jgi:hypothetical protein
MDTRYNQQYSGKGLDGGAAELEQCQPQTLQISYPYIATGDAANKCGVTGLPVEGE